MERQAMKDLEAWKNRRDRKPLLIRGARQVGKTWLMQEFGRRFFRNVAYVNFEGNPRMRAAFAADYDTQRLLRALQIETGTSIVPGETLIIFDEVQEVPQALTSLKYFAENAPEYHIVAAGSLLGVALHPGTSFPVGKVDLIDLFPLTFLEFLDATDNSQLRDLLEHPDLVLVHSFRDRYIELLRQYYYVGGMPAMVTAWVADHDTQEVRRLQRNLLAFYDQDFSKHAPLNAVPRMRMVWNAIPAQLARENRRFIYGQVQQGARAKEFELALQWLEDAGLLTRVYRVTKPGIPLAAYMDQQAFKVYFLDVGLLSAMADLDARTLLEGNRVFEEFKGSLTEQYVLEQLVADLHLRAFYHTTEHSSGEIDFLVEQRGNVVPIEVKATENLRSRSLQAYCQKYKPRYAVRTSLSDFRKESWLVNIPLYALHFLETIEEF
jgi:predicted AAA+ superfamily ATPase